MRAWPSGLLDAGGTGGERAGEACVSAEAASRAAPTRLRMGHRPLGDVVARSCRAGRRAGYRAPIAIAIIAIARTSPMAPSTAAITRRIFQTEIGESPTMRLAS